MKQNQCEKQILKIVMVQEDVDRPVEREKQSIEFGLKRPSSTENGE